MRWASLMFLVTSNQKRFLKMALIRFELFPFPMKILNGVWYFSISKGTKRWLPKFMAKRNSLNFCNFTSIGVSCLMEWFMFDMFIFLSSTRVRCWVCVSKVILFDYSCTVLNSSLRALSSISSSVICFCYFLAWELLMATIICSFLLALASTDNMWEMLLSLGVLLWWLVLALFYFILSFGLLGESVLFSLTLLLFLLSSRFILVDILFDAAHDSESFSVNFLSIY